MAEGSYDFVAEALFNELAVDGFFDDLVFDVRLQGDGETVFFDA